MNIEEITVHEHEQAFTLIVNRKNARSLIQSLKQNGFAVSGKEPSAIVAERYVADEYFVSGKDQPALEKAIRSWGETIKLD